jgi:hypothetical protein
MSSHLCGLWTHPQEMLVPQTSNHGGSEDPQPMPFHTVRGLPQRTVSEDEDGTRLSRAARGEARRVAAP